MCSQCEYSTESRGTKMVITLNGQFEYNTAPRLESKKTVTTISLLPLVTIVNEHLVALCRTENYKYNSNDH